MNLRWTQRLRHEKLEECESVPGRASVCIKCLAFYDLVGFLGVHEFELAERTRSSGVGCLDYRYLLLLPCFCV